MSSDTIVIYLGRLGLPTIRCLKRLSLPSYFKRVGDRREGMQITPETLLMIRGGKTINYFDFITAYKDLLAASRGAPNESETEHTILIYETDWVQICYQCNLQNGREIKLVVELALPSWVQQENMTGHVKDMTGDQNARLQDVLKALVTHLSYLLRLSEAGFQLETIAEEGFWSAWILLQATPSRDLFHLLTPPKEII